MREQSNKREQITQQLNTQLARNNLVRKIIPQGPRSMLRAISDSLYYTTSYVNQIINLCKTQLVIGLENHVIVMDKQTLPIKLHYLYTNSVMVTDYKQNPDLSGFTKVHLQLISQIYQRKIIIYYITQDYYLNNLIINNKNYSKTIMLARVQNYYTAVLDKQIYQLTNYIKQFFYDKLLIQSSKIINKKQQKLAPRKKHKKSLSACDQLQYKQIFNTPIKLSFKYHQSPIKKNRTVQEQIEDMNLIFQCNKAQSKKSGLIHGFLNQFQKYNYQYVRYQNTIHSQKILSLYTVSQNGTPVNKNKNKIYQKESEINKRYTGRLKFFDENKNYGFIVIDQDLSDIFVHFDDLSKAGMTKQYMRTTKHGNIIRFNFACMVYIGKYDKSRKAVDLIIQQEQYHHLL